MAPNRVADRNTSDTVDMMIFASVEITRNLEHARAHWAPLDADITSMVDSMIVKFTAFAEAARTGKVCDPITLRTLGRVYEDIARHLCHALACDSRAEALLPFVNASGSTTLAAHLVESGHLPAKILTASRAR